MSNLIKMSNLKKERVIAGMGGRPNWDFIDYSECSIGYKIIRMKKESYYMRVPRYYIYLHTKNLINKFQPINNSFIKILEKHEGRYEIGYIEQNAMPTNKQINALINDHIANIAKEEMKIRYKKSQEKRIEEKTATPESDDIVEVASTEKPINPNQVSITLSGKVEEITYTSNSKYMFLQLSGNNDINFCIKNIKTVLRGENIIMSGFLGDTITDGKNKNIRIVTIDHAKIIESIPELKISAPFDAAGKEDREVVEQFIRDQKHGIDNYEIDVEIDNQEYIIDLTRVNIDTVLCFSDESDFEYPQNEVEFEIVDKSNSLRFNLWYNFETGRIESISR